MPFLDYTSTAVPRSFSELLDWSEYMYLLSPEIREINKRLFNYFNTDIEVQAINSGKQTLSDDDARSWKNQLTNDMKWNVEAHAMLDNVSIYGNDFISVVAPTRRFLNCSVCGNSVELETLAKQSGSDFKYSKGKFLARCQSSVCRREKTPIQPMNPEDMRIRDASKYTIKHWPVREIVLHYYMWTDEAQVFWKIPEEYKRTVLFGDLHTLATADLGVLDAIDKEKLFKFRPDRIFHAKEPTLSGLKTKGWGIPRTLYLSRQAWQLQVIRRQVQAIGLDFIVPIRLLSPANIASRGANGGMVNPALQVKHEDFSRMASTLTARHRMNPAGIHTMQVPVEYRLLGGEANQLFPVEIQEKAKEDLLDAGGFPIDIYKSNLTVQTAPVGLRLFEAQNRAIPLMLNLALSFVANRVSELANKDPIEASHQRVTLVDNLELSMARLQMAMGGQTSMTNALKPLNMNFEEEARQNMRDQALLMELQQEHQEMMANQQGGMQMIQQAAQGGAQGQGGQGGGQGDPAMVDPTAGMLPSNGLVIPQDLTGMEQAVSALAQTLSQADPATRRRELGILQTQNPTAHGLLRTRLEQTDRQMASEGRQMMLQGGM